MAPDNGRHEVGNVLPAVAQSGDFDPAGGEAFRQREAFGRRAGGRGQRGEQPRPAGRHLVDGAREGGGRLRPQRFEVAEDGHRPLEEEVPGPDGPGRHPLHRFLGAVEHRHVDAGEGLSADGPGDADLAHAGLAGHQ